MNSNQVSPKTKAVDARRTRTSKVLVIALFAWILGFAGLAFWVSLQPRADAQTRASPFKPWDGEWEGEFTTYKLTGELVSRLKVHQSYRHVNDDDEFRQEGHFTNTDLATGESYEEKAANTATFEGEKLRCKTYRRLGSEAAVHRGRIQDGCIFWSREEPGAVESFRERVEGDTYSIDGVGIYGDRATAEPLLFVGRYHRVSEGEKKKE